MLVGEALADHFKDIALSRCERISDAAAGLRGTATCIAARKQASDKRWNFAILFDPGASVAGIKVASFGTGLIDLFLSLETGIGCPPAITMEGTGACAAFIVSVVDLIPEDGSVSTAPAVALTVLAGVGFADET